MKNSRIYGFAGVYPDHRVNNGKVDTPDEVVNMMQGFAEGDKLKEILSRYALLDQVPLVIQVTNITALTAEQLEALRPGDVVNKSDATGIHAYHVSYKSATGLCLTYCDCENVETVAYNKTDNTWAYDSTDVTHIAE